MLTRLDPPAGVADADGVGVAATLGSEIVRCPRAAGGPLVKDLADSVSLRPGFDGWRPVHRPKTIRGSRHCGRLS
jgi:hypothetical protein